MFTLNDLLNELLPEQRAYMGVAKHFNIINVQHIDRLLVSNMLPGRVAICIEIEHGEHKVAVSRWFDRTSENLKLLSEITNKMNQMLDVYKMVGL